jgi:hypothetical protein
MGNQVTYQNKFGNYSAYIHLNDGISRFTYMSLFEFGDINKLINAVNAQYECNTVNQVKLVDITFNINNKAISWKKIQYMNIENVIANLRTIHIRSIHEADRERILQEMLVLLKWSMCKPVDTLRPRTIVACSKRILAHIIGDRGNGLNILMNTEIREAAIVKYYKKQLIISTDNIYANRRIMLKIDQVKLAFKNDHISKDCKLCNNKHYIIANI